MKLVTAHEMRSLDDAAIRGHKIPSLELMERAGRGVSDAVQKLLPKKKGFVLIVAGRGNNGGDGLVAARHLLECGYEIAVIMLASASDLSPDARANWELLARATTHIYSALDPAELNSRTHLFAQASCIVDAVLGTGLASEVKGLAANAIELINSSGALVVAVDIPSGLSADDGMPLGKSVRANLTVTFGLPKRGHFLGMGIEHTGKLEVVDIGIPAEETRKVESKMEMIEPSIFRHYLRRRNPDSHKGKYGHVVILAGSRGHLGAGYLACKAALRTGCGLVTYCLPEKSFAFFDARYPEVMCDAIPDGGTAHFHSSGLSDALKALNGKSAAAIGPAIGTDPDTREFLNAFIRSAKLPLVIDADGLNLLDPASMRMRGADTILTPHPGEMSRLAGRSTDEIQKKRIEIASGYASSSGAIVILKGMGTVVAHPDGRVAINTTGNPGMATAGMGDALTGMIASFIAQGVPAWEAAVASVYVHGLAGDIAAAEQGERALITTDLIKKIGSAMKEITENP